jgi:hypothetical protein
VLYFKFLCNYFLKFIVHKMSPEIIKSKMVVMIGEEKTDITDAHVTMG